MQTVGTHLEPGRFPLGPEPVLPPGEDPQAGAGVAVEGEDDVDRVLEGARAGEVPVLGDVPGQQDGDPLALGEADQRIRAPPNLRRAAGKLPPRRVPEGLDRVDREQERVLGRGGGQDVREVAPGSEPDLLGADVEASCTVGHLGVGLLARHDETATASSGEPPDQLEEQR